MKLILEDNVHEIDFLMTILARISPFGEIFGEFGEKMLHYVVFGFGEIESLLMKLGSILGRELRHKFLRQ